MTARRAAVVAAVAAMSACANPSPLEDAGRGAAAAGEAADLAAWRTLAARARPLDAASELLDAALAERDPGRQVVALEAWARAGGRLADPPPVRAVEAGDATLELLSLGVAAAAAGARDDAALEAALYTAQRLRRDGTDMTAAAAAVAIVRKAIAARPYPPVFAASFAPTDAEVARAFAAEALAVARIAAWSTTADAARVAARGGASYRELARGGAPGGDDPLAGLGWLASAPVDRDGFLAALARHADTHPELAREARVLYDGVDAYRRWLAVSK